MAKEGLQFEFSASTAEYRKAVESMPRDLQKAADEIEEIGQEINSSLGGAIGKGLVQGLAGAGVALKLRDVISQFDQVSDAAKRFGTTAEDIQRVDFASKSAGSSMEAVAQAMDSAGVRANKAARGAEELGEAFNRAGIDATAFSMADLSERIEMVARAQNSAAGDSQQLANITEALGQSVAGVDFVSMADGMRDVAVVSNETVRQLSQANDEIVKFERNVTIGVAKGLGFVGDLFERLGSTFAALEQDPFSFEPNPIIGKTVEELEAMEAALQPLPPLFERATETTDQASQSAVNYSQVLKQLVEVNAEMEASMARMEKGAGALGAQLAEAELRLSQLSQQFAQSGDADVFKEIEKTAKEILSLRQQTAREEEKIRSETAKTSEEYRKQADAQARLIVSVDEEIQMLEAKLSGNEALSEELQSQRDFRKAFEATGSAEQADKLAGLLAQERQMEGGRRGGGGTSAPKPTTALDRLRAAAETDPNARAELMRLQDREARDMARADQMRSLGRFGSAARAQMAAETRAEASASREMQKQFMQSRFGARNVGDAFRNLGQEAFSAGMSLTEVMRRMEIEQQPGESQAEAFQRFVEEQGKTEAERKEEAARGGGPSGAGQSPADPMGEVIGKLEQIIQEITDRLPQNALAA